MNARRFMTDMGLAHHLRRVSRTLSLARRDQPVSGATLRGRRLPPGIDRLGARVVRATRRHAGIQFASQSVSSTKVTTNIAPTILSCPRTKFGRSAALILIIAPPEHIEM